MDEQPRVWSGAWRECGGHPSSWNGRCLACGTPIDSGGVCRARRPATAGEVALHERVRKAEAERGDARAEVERLAEVYARHGEVLAERDALRARGEALAEALRSLPKRVCMCQDEIADEFGADHHGGATCRSVSPDVRTEWCWACIVNDARAALAAWEKGR